ncbi:MAG: haloalkane dehalogenase [Sphingomonadaceae bacterium]
MPVYRTPESHFARIADFPWEPHYTMVDGGQLGPLRMAHYEAGPAHGPVVLLLHGEPTWAYLYRKMIPPLVAGGARVLVPDLIGFGRSDKPEDPSQISYETMFSWLSEWFELQALGDVTLFCQDWGGLLGLRLVAANSDLFARVVASNTFLPTGDGQPTEAFLRWRAYSQQVARFDCGAIVNQATAHGISAEAQDAYNAPFPEERTKTAPRRMPMMVPVGAGDPEAAVNRLAWERLRHFRRPFLTLFADRDPVTAPYAAVFQRRIAGAEGQPHATIANAGHFIQEDAGEELAERVLAFMQQAQPAVA